MPQRAAFNVLIWLGLRRHDLRASRSTEGTVGHSGLTVYHAKVGRHGKCRPTRSVPMRRPASGDDMLRSLARETPISLMYGATLSGSPILGSWIQSRFSNRTLSTDQVPARKGLRSDKSGRAGKATASARESFQPQTADCQNER